MRLFLFILTFFLTFHSCYAFDKSQINPENIQTDEISSRYTFEETMNGKVVKIKKGTTIPITLQTQIDTSVTQENDEVAATLNEDLKIDGAVVAKQNSVLYGKVIKAKSASNCMRGGKVKIKFDKLVTTDDKTYTVATKAIDFVVSAEDKIMTISQTVMQVVLIAAYAVLTGGIGAVVVAACFLVTPNGLLPVLTKKGTDAIIPASTPMEVSLDASLDATATY